MNSSFIPEDYLNSLPLGAIVVKNDSETLNHQVVFVNEQFLRKIGYTVEDIPDKNTWWETAYPDKAYQKVVAQYWELAVETYAASDGKYVVMDAEIRTKSRGSKKFRVYSEAENHLIPGHYIVMFMELD